MTQQELDRIGKDAVRELDYDFHLDSADEQGSVIHYHFTNRRGKPDRRKLDVDVDLNRTGQSREAIKLQLRHDLEFAAHGA